MVAKIHLRRNESFSFCGLYAGRKKVKPFTSDFREATCKNCIKSAHYWRNREEVLRKQTRMEDIKDIRRGAIAVLYKKYNRELAAEVDALKALVNHLTIFIDTITLKLIMEEHPEVRKIMEASDV